MVYLLIVSYIYSYLCQFIYIQYIHTVQTYNNFILSEYSAGFGVDRHPDYVFDGSFNGLRLS